MTQLSKRVGMSKMLSKFMDSRRLREFASGLFYSKLNYCLPVFGNVFGIEKYKENNRRYSSFTMKDNNRLQILQNKVNILLIDADPLTSTAELLRLTDSLSIHQMTAYQTAVLTHKVVQSGKPAYIADKLKHRQTGVSLRGGGGIITIPEYKLSICREGFVFRGACLYNMLEESIRTEKNISMFKIKTKRWVRENISMKPKSIFSEVFEKRRYEADLSIPIQVATSHQPNQQNVNKITRYFSPINKM